MRTCKGFSHNSFLKNSMNCAKCGSLFSSIPNNPSSCSGSITRFFPHLSVTAVSGSVKFLPGSHSIFDTLVVRPSSCVTNTSNVMTEFLKNGFFRKCMCSLQPTRAGMQRGVRVLAPWRSTNSERHCSGCAGEYLVEEIKKTPGKEKKCGRLAACNERGLVMGFEHRCGRRHSPPGPFQSETARLPVCG